MYTHSSAAASASGGALAGAGGLTFASRGVGELAVVESIPDTIVSLFSVLTHLGDPWVCLFGVSFAYVVGERIGIDRSAAAFVLGLGLGAVGLTVGLKELFALPRPPGAAEPGYGFPSGHTLGATVFWGGTALAANVGRRRLRLGVAAAAVVAVAASRVIIGVHYLADVIAGVTVGVAFLAIVFAAGPGLRRPAAPSDRTVIMCYLAGGVISAAAAFTNPIEIEVLLGVGTAVGGAAIWSVLGRAALDTNGDLSTRSVVVGAVAFPLPLVVMAAVAELSMGSLAFVAAGAFGGVTLLSLPVAVSSLFE
ncbi:pap2 superfamily protein [Halogeometricum borinquense DSM 11551]|uniref:PAP2 superfamily protein n=1 Tax=Halogeometricum borinquense (strain ATCC 700274 / DSM 11551 / JCM 10706 / KCTC 4070 / PR3) TaxID=469382 RepID=E4NMJ3_HALBP|nr:phosphatase PAP2 family protein [Halogeometricum borinquense]ADQ68491.1 PAP2 superfamily protein [Halogeometricum borinquense DSM 11551]ELY27866.1 pap2 superfamily protein [Halogeometricum borinquense DSM 11551]